MTSKGNLMKQSPDYHSFPPMKKKNDFLCGEIEFRLSLPNFPIRLLLQEPLKTADGEIRHPFFH